MPRSRGRSARLGAEREKPCGARATSVVVSGRTRAVGSNNLECEVCVVSNGAVRGPIRAATRDSGVANSQRAHRRRDVARAAAAKQRAARRAGKKGEGARRTESGEGRLGRGVVVAWALLGRQVRMLWTRDEPDEPNSQALSVFLSKTNVSQEDHAEYEKAWTINHVLM